MGSVRNVDRGFFPLDEELELLAGGLAPRGQEELVRLSSWMPFERAVELMEDMQGISVSPSMSKRNSEAAGATYVEMQTEEVERIEKEMPPAPPGAEKMQISADGAMVPLLHGQWAEVRTLVIGEVQPAVEECGEWVVHTRNLSYFSPKISSEAFERLALVEMQRRGVENAGWVAAPMDGSDWLQSLTDFSQKQITSPQGDNSLPLARSAWSGCLRCARNPFFSSFLRVLRGESYLPLTVLYSLLSALCPPQSLIPDPQSLIPISQSLTMCLMYKRPCLPHPAGPQKPAWQNNTLGKC
jgi:hypothetical protein